VVNNSSQIQTGGDAIVNSLIANGVDTVFGLPGAQIYPLFDSLKRNEARIRTVGARHEQGVAYMAFGYARSTGRPGVFAVVPGPGVLNTTAALCTAMGCNTPVLCVTGQIPSAFIGKGRGHLHELRDQRATLRTLVKWAERIESPSDAEPIIAEAFRQMLSGRPGPVAVEMAWDVMASSQSFAPSLSSTEPDPAPRAEARSMDEAIRVIDSSRRPMIITGSGAQHAALAVNDLAERISAPVAALRGGRGIVAEDQKLGISSYTAKLLWPDTDLLIGIGSRLELPYMRWSGMMKLVDAADPPPNLIRIDIDSEEMARLRPTIGLVADSSECASELVRRVASIDRDPWRAQVASAKVQAADDIKAAPHVGYLKAIRNVLPRDGILVDELCQAGFSSYFAYPCLAPRTFISAGYQGTLGSGFQTALGVKVANPGRPVVSITGDGGFMFGVQELATAVQERIGLITVLFNNNAFGNVARDQQANYAGREIGSNLQNPDFIALARAFGVPAQRVHSPVELSESLRRWLETDRPVLIEVVTSREEEPSPWPFLLKW
jgi:acetolactate synthase I/II/III large subunit